MTTVAVAGFDTTAIHAARDAAGIGGTVILPNGVYDVDGLTASVLNQTWKGERSVVLKRTATAPAAATLLQTAPGLQLIDLTIDGNRGVNSNVGNGIWTPTGSVGLDLDLERVTIQNVCSWGIATQDCELRMRRCTIQNTALACVFWSDTTGPGRLGPQIDDCLFDRVADGTAPSNGCVIIGSSRSGQYIFSPRFTNNRCRMQYPGSDNSVLFECRHSTDLRCTGNVMTGGHTAISVGEGSYDVIEGNICKFFQSYGVEYSGNEGVIDSNVIHGVGTGSVCGIIGNACVKSKATGNNINSVATRFQVVNGGQLQDIDNI